MPKLPGVSQKDAVRVYHQQNFGSYSECLPNASLITKVVKFTDPTVKKLLRDLHL